MNPVGHPPCLAERLVVGDVRGGRPAQGLAEVRDHALDPASARDRDAVPAPLAVMSDGVPGIAEDADGRVGVGELRLLHQKHVGFRAVEPPLDFLEASVQRVDVPRRDAHRAKNISSGVRRRGADSVKLAPEIVSFITNGHVLLVNRVL